jgi:DNA-binding CsgD family transcriptional regulator
MGDLEEGAEVYLGLLEGDESNAEYALNCGLALKELCKVDAAKKMLLRAARLGRGTPLEVAARRLLAHMLHGLGDLRGAAEQLSSALLRIGNILQECGVGTQVSGRISDEDVVRLRSLTAREWDVLRGLLANQRVPVIARRLGLSPHTVRNHLKAMFRKLGVSSQSDLLERLSGAQWERAGV